MIHARRFLTPLLVISLLGTSLYLHAKVYKKVHPDGTVEYTDQPVEGGEAMKVQPSNTYKAPDSVPPLQSSTIENEVFKYTSIKITSPQNEATIRSNEGNINISGMITPTLKKDHYVQLMMNGQPLDKPIRGMSFNLKNVNRGEHSFSLNVVTKNGEIFQKGEAITVFLHRQIAR